jgi:hypothetical protein
VDSSCNANAASCSASVTICNSAGDSTLATKSTNYSCGPQPCPATPDVVPCVAQPCGFDCAAAAITSEPKNQRKQLVLQSVSCIGGEPGGGSCRAVVTFCDPVTLQRPYVSFPADWGAYECGPACGGTRCLAGQQCCGSVCAPSSATCCGGGYCGGDFPQCCGDAGCAPADAVCCGVGMFCPAGSQCCTDAFAGCCPEDSYCCITDFGPGCCGGAASTATTTSLTPQPRGGQTFGQPPR